MDFSSGLAIRNLGRRYRDRPGVSLVPADYSVSPRQQKAGPCAFSPFREDSKYFPAAKPQLQTGLRRGLAVPCRQLRPLFGEIT